MQLKPEALNALKLPIKVKAGFLGSVKLKVLYLSQLVRGYAEVNVSCRWAYQQVFAAYYTCY